MYERTGNLVKKKFMEYLLPTILTSMAISLASVVDGIIVGNLLGDMALAAVGLAGPVIFCINMIYMLFGVGGLTCASIARGKREEGKSNLIFTLTIVFGMAAMMLFLVVMQIFLVPISGMLAGGDPVLTSMTADYLRPLLFTGPALMFSSGMALFIRTDGRPKSSAMVLIVANVVNLLLDYVLIRFLNTGIAGAGISTTAGYVVGTVIVIPYLLSKNRSFRFARLGKGSISVLGDILKTGFPKALYQICNFLRSLILNSIIISVLGSIGMSVMTVCVNVLMLSNIFVGGVSDALLPIVGTLFGERDYYGIRQSMKSAYIVLAIACTALIAFFMITPQTMGIAFGITSAEGMAAVIPALRLFAVYLPFDAMIQLLQNFYTTTDRKTIASIMVFMNGLLFIVLYAFLFATINASLLWLCYACSGATTLAMIAVVSIGIRKREQVKGILLLREQNEIGIKHDITINATTDEAVGLSDQLIGLCTQSGLSDLLANHVGIAVEEMAISTIHYAHKDKKKGIIDIMLLITEANLTIRFRDNGVLFNPVEYIADEDDGCITDGIALIKKMASGVDYANQLGFNTTVISFDIK